MNACPRLTATVLGTALALAAMLPSPASAKSNDPQATSCPLEAPAASAKKRKGQGLGGLLGATKRADIGKMLGRGVLGDSRAAQVAEAVAGMAIEGSDAASAVAGTAGTSRTAQAAGTVVGVASELARHAPAAGCSGAAD